MIELSELVEVDTADIYKQGVLAARMRLRDDHVEFRYAEDYLSAAGQPVATTLPLTATSVRTLARSVPPYFAGLLPEGRRLTALRRALKTSADDDFSMLLAIGEDPVGDVQVVIHGEPPPAFGAGTAPLTNPATTSFTQLLAQANGAPTDDGSTGADRGALAGVQDKVSGRMISILTTLTGTGFILKLDPPEFPHLVANEAFFVQMARACGIETADVQVVSDRDGRPGLLVARFDRFLSPDATVGARSCEDACQIAGRYPADKYALTTEHVFDLAADLSASPRGTIRTLLRQLVFALITGNGDFHAKNISMLQRDGDWDVSPAYDLPSSRPYGDTTLAMSIGGNRRGQVSRRALVAFAVDRGLPESAALLSIDDLVRRATPWLERLDELPFDPKRIHDLRSFMRARLRLLQA